MFLAIVLIITLFWLLILLNSIKPRERYTYKCFLLSLPESVERRQNFLRSYSHNIPLEIIYGANTKILSVAREFEDRVDPEYFEKAVQIHYDPSVKRPDITYFNLGAIGCYMGHMEFYERCFERGLRYAVIFEDNVVIKSRKLYDEIQKVINEKGDDFEMCFFHCLCRLTESTEKDLEKVRWISSTKCYLVNVNNMRRYQKFFLPMDNHIDMKHEDIIDQGARVYYKDLRNCIKIDVSVGPSTIGHSQHERPEFFSKIYPELPRNVLRPGY